MVSPTPQGNVVRLESAVEVITVYDMLPNLKAAKRILLAHQQQVLSVAWLEWHHDDLPVPTPGSWLYAWLTRREGEQSGWMIYRYLVLKP